MVLALALAGVWAADGPASGSVRVAAAAPAGAPADGPAAASDAASHAAVSPAGIEAAEAVDAAIPEPAPPPTSAPAAPPALLTPVTAVVGGVAALAAVVLVRRGWWRLDGSPSAARRLRADWSLAFALGLLVGSIILGPLVVAAMNALPGDPPDLGTLGGQLAVAIPIHGVQALAIAVWWAGGRRANGRPVATSASGAATARAAGPGPFPTSIPAAASQGIAGLLLTWPIVLTVTTLTAVVLVAAGGDPPEAIAHATLARIAADPWSPAAIGTMVLVVAIVPWVEEAIYRGMMQGGLVAAGLGRWTAILIVASIFALRHLGIAAPHAVAGLFVLGVGFGVVAERTGRLTAAVVMHAAFNLANVLLAVFTTPAP